MLDIKYPAQIFWGNELDGYVVIGIANSSTEDVQIRNKYLERLKFHSYYVRYWPIQSSYESSFDSGYKVDYGSHTNFFLIKSI